MLIVHKGKRIEDSLIMLHLIDRVAIAGIGIKSSLALLLVTVSCCQLLVKLGMLLPCFAGEAEHGSFRLTGYVFRLKGHDKLPVLHVEHFLILVIE